MNEKVQHLVVDTSGFLKTGNLQDIGYNIYTVQNVINEVTSKSQIRKLVVLPYDLQIMEPNSESIKFITEFSKKTGDYHCLSATDIKVMALAYQMEMEYVGRNHLKSEPKQSRIVNFTKQSTENPRDICGFYLPPKKRNSSDGVNDHESLILSLPFLGVINEYLGDHSYLKGFSPSCLDLAVLNLLTSTGYPCLKLEVSASDTDFTFEEQLHHLNRWRIHITSIADEVINSLSKDDQVTDDDAANFIQHLVSSFYNREDSENMLKNQLNDLLIGEAEGHLDDDGFCDDENEDFEEHSSEDDDSDDGWITPNNIKDAMKKMGGEIYEEKCALVGCITTDFAMQNVLKQIGLSVISQDGHVIKELRTHVLRCHACFYITNNPAGTSLTPGTRSTLQGASVVLGAGLKYQFCPKCGYQGTLKRVAVIVDKDGKQVVNVSCRRPITGRGKRFSVPRPKGGKHSNDPIICADQRVPQRHATRLARMKTDALNPDYIAGFSPFVMRDVNSRAAMLGIHGSELKHWLRKNPNENKLGRRRKK